MGIAGGVCCVRRVGGQSDVKGKRKEQEKVNIECGCKDDYEEASIAS